MDQATATKLNRITRRFYEASARGFTAGRELPWPGWVRLLTLLAPAFSVQPRITVLDIGCGNGRFCRCLDEHLGRSFHYLGLDASPRLVELARDRLAGIPDAQCEVRDLVEGDPGLPAGRFTLVAAFGVLHHVPGFGRRRRLVEQLCRRVERGGALTLSTWLPCAEQRIETKRVPWGHSIRRAGEAIDASQIELGDHLIARPGESPRYCHLVDRTEEERLFAGLPLDLVAAFDGDGRRGPLNRYFLLAGPDSGLTA